MTTVGSHAYDLLAARPSKNYSGEAHDAPIDAETVEQYKGIRVLVLGAGGVGCEILHNLAMTGISQIHVIDMDTVDLTNLNRQFLFRQSDIGKFKAEAAANFIMKRFPHVKVTFSNDRVENNPPVFFQNFQFVLLAVDTIRARKWVNEMLASLVVWRPTVIDGKNASILTNDSYAYQADEDQSVIPIIDVGSEGYMCNAKTIIHGTSGCMDCDNFFSESKTVQVCTIESIPRRPEHCVTFIKLKEWDRLKPFGTHLNDKGQEVTVPIDGDNEQHIAWIAQRSQERLEKFKLPGSIDFTFTQGVIKNSIAAVGFTNAIVASVMVNEMFKILLHWGKPAAHFGFYSGSNRVSSYRVDLAPNPKCKVCVPNRHLNLSFNANLADVMSALMQHPFFEQTAKRRRISATCHVSLKKYLNEQPLFTLVGKAMQRQNSGEGSMEREDSSGGMQRQDSITNAAEGDRFYDIMHEHYNALLAAIATHDRANDGVVKIKAKSDKIKDVFGLKTLDDTNVAPLFITVFDSRYLINWTE